MGLRKEKDHPKFADGLSYAFILNKNNLMGKDQIGQLEDLLGRVIPFQKDTSAIKNFLSCIGRVKRTYSC
jgi:hypothetical protein